MSAAAGILSGFHAAIAFARSEPHWLLNEQDAKAYGQALANAIRHLPIVIAQKYFDYTAFGLAIATYEFPRIALSAQLARQGAPKPGSQSGLARGPAQVFQFHTPSQPAPTPASATQPAPSQPPPSAIDPGAIETDMPNLGPA